MAPTDRPDSEVLAETAEAQTLACGGLGVNASLGRGDVVLSCNGSATLIHQANDGNVVLYDSAGPLWATNTSGQSTTSFVMQGDGNLVLYGPNGALWSSGTSGNPGATLALQNDCNMVIYGSGGAVLWSSHTQCRAELGVVAGKIDRTYSNKLPTRPLDNPQVLDDIHALGARWVRVDVLPKCAATVDDNCAPAGTYERVFSALHGRGVKVLALVNVPTVCDVVNGVPQCHDKLLPNETANDYWNNRYEPRVEEVLSQYHPDALEIINEPNAGGRFAAEDFALIVKRTYEKLHDGLHVTTPIIAGGILNAYDDPNSHDQYHRAVANSTAYRDYLAVYGRWPMDGWGIHPYQAFNWSLDGHPSNMGAFLTDSLNNIRSIIGHPEVPFWVTEFGWQDAGCGNYAGCGVCGSAPALTACDSLITSMMTSAVSALRSPALHVAVALWYDYRDDEPSGEQFGLRYNAANGYATKPQWSTFQSLAGGSGSPVNFARPTTRVGIFRSGGVWAFDANGDGYDLSDPQIQFGLTGDTPVVGDWTGSGKTCAGIVRNVNGLLYWQLDKNCNGYDGEPTLQFGLAGDTPVVGDWTGTGKTCVGIVRNVSGQLFWQLDKNCNGYDGDASIQLGLAGDTPVVGDWTGIGKTCVGIVRNTNGQLFWQLDKNCNGYDGDASIQFGLGGDTTVVGDWTGTGKTCAGIVRNINGQLYWQLDKNCNGYDGEPTIQLGQAGDKPVVGNWDGSGATRPGVFRSNGAYWLLDRNGNGWDANDQLIEFGISTDTPVVGNW